MPHLTPSRALIVVLSVSLVVFFWSFGAPAQPAPIIPLNGPPLKPLEKPLVPPLPKPAIPPEEDAKGGGAKGGGGKIAAPGTADAEKPPSGGEGKEKAKEPTPPRLKTAVSPGQTDPPSPSPVDSAKLCKDDRGAPAIMVIVRTSRAEIHGNLPAHLKSLFDCVANVAIFSDHSGTIDGYTIHNALDTISSSTTKHYDEFREYGKMQADKNYAPSVEKTKALDKWKFLPMVYKTFRMRPDSRWYLFIEKDTSLSWTNLLQWLDRLDYRIQYYSGAPMYQGEIRFAQRGPGILLSYGALRQYAKSYDELYASEWESHVGEECCGDRVLAQAMAESAVEFYPAFPLLQGETPSSLDWTQGHWCAPIVSWHGMKTEETEQLWSLQQQWTKKHGWEVPYLIRNAFEDFILPHFKDKIEDWDNISSDTVIYGEKERKERKKEEAPSKPDVKEKEKEKEKPEGSRLGPEPPILQETERPPRDRDEGGKQRARRRRDTIDWDKIGQTIKDAADSAEKCQAVCQRTEDCLQWKFTPKGESECHLGKTLRLGKKLTKEHKESGGEDWTSGWIIDRIKNVTEGWGECENVNWSFHQG